MKVASVAGENIGPFREFKLDLLDRGLICVQADNQVSSATDSNGSGKSYILEVFNWTLTGETIRGQKGDKVIRRNAGKGARGEVVLIDGGDRYVIERGRKHKALGNGARVTLNGVDITKGPKEVDDQIAAIIKRDPKTLRYSVLFDGNHIPAFATIGDKAIKAIIERALDVEVFDKGLAVVRAKKQAAGVVLLDAEHDLKLARTREGDAGSELARLQADRDTWKDDLTRRTQELQAKIDSFPPLPDPAEYELLQRQHVEMLIELGKKKSDLQIKRRELATIQVGDLASLSRNAAQSEIKLESHQNQLKLLLAPDALQRMAMADQSIATSLAVAGAAKRELEVLQAAPAGVCPVCNQSVANPTSMLLHRQVLEQRINVATQTAGSRLRELEEKLAANIGTTRDSILQASEELETYKKALQEATAGEANVKAVRLALDELEVAASAAGDQVRIVEAKLAQLQTARDAYNQLGNRLDGIRAEKNPYEGLVDNATMRLSSLQDDVLKALDVKEKAARRLQLLGQLEDLYGPKGLRVAVIEAATPLLNERANYYAQQLVDEEIKIGFETFRTNAKGQKVEVFTVNIDNKHGAEEYVGQSTGEQRKIDIAIALAFSDLISARSANQLDFWVADEIAEHLDATAQARLIKVMQDIASRRGTVLMISHNPINDMISNCVIVEKTRDGSTVRALESW